VCELAMSPAEGLMNVAVLLPLAESHSWIIFANLLVQAVFQY
jgi:hypothetical protein